MHELRRIAIPLRPTALEWLGFCARSCAHELGLHARAVVLSVPEKLRAKAGCAACIYFCKTASAAFGAALSSCSDVARTKRSLTSKRYGLAKLARKTVVEILFRKVFLKFSTRLNFKILTKPDSKLRRSRIMKFYPVKF